VQSLNSLIKYINIILYGSINLLTQGMKGGSINLLTQGMKDGSKIAKQRLDLTRTFSSGAGGEVGGGVLINPFNKELELNYKLDKHKHKKSL
jgi:hypothetical protein